MISLLLNYEGLIVIQCRWYTEDNFRQRLKTPLMIIAYAS